MIRAWIVEIRIRGICDGASGIPPTSRFDNDEAVGAAAGIEDLSHMTHGVQYGGGVSESLRNELDGHLLFEGKGSIGKYLLR